MVEPTFLSAPTTLCSLGNIHSGLLKVIVIIKHSEMNLLHSKFVH
jgi:hypothetical protein